MQTRIWRIEGKGRLASASVDEFHREGRNPEACFWLDVAQPTAEALEDLLGGMGLHPLALERCLDPVASSGALRFEDHVVVQVALQLEWGDLERHLLSIVCLPGAVVTIHASVLIVLDDLGRELPVLLGRHRSAPSSFVYLILDRLVDESVEQTLAARRHVDELEETLIGEPEVDSIGEAILASRRKPSHLEITLEEQHRCLMALLSVESNAFNVAELRHYFRDVASHVEHSLRYVETIEARLAELHQQYQLILQGRTTSRLQTLTILSAIFMPLTLIAGIYGMNFRYMPELRSPWGYPLVLLVMLVLAGGLLWFFYRRGWFD